ncbi:MAG: hypothetical protein GWM98_06485, partial [Nitrospinaceae bacterium]|nr:hypothetical protein [Nitrospinaceae bacterium]NIR54203.1 hypothetical protein [Nitrospinaceae bacterium]NIS84618.1 hypothetical protein [Nitrospinaceae bacterium]NIT81413.1 hypothetical protein [Nitrospinaceae bacterium]NIU43697.1 hypothetical protein [Nitrospinaceae bacterium]
MFHLHKFCAVFLSFYLLPVLPVFAQAPDASPYLTKNRMAALQALKAGKAAEAAGDFDKAGTLYEKAIRLHPNFDKA